MNINLNSNKKEYNKKSMSLPINIVVMMIIGIIIFGLGMGLFSKMSKAGNEQVNELNNKIINNIHSLECPGDEWICTSSNKLKNGEMKTFQIYIANQDNSEKEFKIDFNNLNNLNSKDDGIKNNCGEIKIKYLKDSPIKIQSGDSASIPFIAIASKIKKTPCSFVTSLKLEDKNGNEISKTAVIINVE